MSPIPTLSVVVACGGAEGPLARCLRAIEASCSGLTAEVILVSPAVDRVATPSPSTGRGMTVIQRRASGLVPELWAAGYRASTGRIVAFTTDRFSVAPGWGEALVSAVQGGATGAGGPIDLAPDTGPVDWAVYLLRYSAFMPPMAAGRVREIAGDNAAYDRPALERHAASFKGGFWEVDFHRRIRAEGGYLVTVPAASAAFTGSDSLMRMLHQRYLHGAHSGAMRTRSGGIPIWRTLMVAPLVPIVLTGRILARTLGKRTSLPQMLGSLPVLCTLASAWALGEAAGALRVWSRRHFHQDIASRV